MILFTEQRCGKYTQLPLHSALNRPSWLVYPARLLCRARTHRVRAGGRYLSYIALGTQRELGSIFPEYSRALSFYSLQFYSFPPSLPPSLTLTYITQTALYSREPVCSLSPSAVTSYSEIEGYTSLCIILPGNL